MKDLSPLYEHDLALQRKQLLGDKARPAEQVSLASEELMEQKRAKYESCLSVAYDILDDARITLAVRFRFLDRALWRMPLKPTFELYGIASDGVSLFYDPEYVVARYRISMAEVVRDVAHCLFHCVFRHPFMLYSVVRAPWDAACDIAIESLLLDLLGEAFPCNMDRRERQALRILGAQLEGVLTAERLYLFFLEKGQGTDFASLGPIFRRDAHGLWYGEDQRPAHSAGATGAARQRDEHNDGGALPDTKGAPPLQGTESALASGGGADGEEPSSLSEEQDEQQKGAGSGSDSSFEADGQPDREELARQWEDVSRQMQMELEADLSRRGDEAGSLVAQLRAVNRERCDYESFLSRFAVLGERMLVNPDEFDYIYYLFGLQRYGNMPLIEPLEYKESRAICDFVIAFDTSESCSGDLVQAFVQKTYNILAQQNSFHTRVNVHIVQCDARIQDDVKITSLDQLELYLQNMELRGFGGTDFRPVFEYVNLLCEKGEFSDLRGLVYFTDGQGVYPRRQPGYETVFVFLDDGYSNPDVPPWALKLLLDERELKVASEVGGKAEQAKQKGRQWI